MALLVVLVECKGLTPLLLSQNNYLPRPSQSYKQTFFTLSIIFIFQRKRQQTTIIKAAMFTFTPFLTPPIQTGWTMETVLTPQGPIAVATPYYSQPGV